MAATRVKVLYFARSRDVTGVGEEEVALPAGSRADTGALLAALLARHPGLASVMHTCVLALNQEYLGAGEDAPLADGDEVAIIPPLSGG
jgi:molybdopterin synthase catalytic subunit